MKSVFTREESDNREEVPVESSVKSRIWESRIVKFIAMIPRKWYKIFRCNEIIEGK